MTLTLTLNSISRNAVWGRGDNFRRDSILGLLSSSHHYPLQGVWFSASLSVQACATQACRVCQNTAAVNQFHWAKYTLCHLVLSSALQCAAIFSSLGLVHHPPPIVTPEKSMLPRNCNQSLCPIFGWGYPCQIGEDGDTRLENSRFYLVLDDLNLGHR